MTNHGARILRLSFVFTAFTLLLMIPGGCAPPEPEEPLTIVPDVSDRLAQFALTAVDADLSTMSNSERQALDKLIEAGRHMDRAFLLQAWPENPAFRERLAAQEGDWVRPALAYFDVMYGPWDRVSHRKPFVGDHPHPPGAGFYPEDLDREVLYLSGDLPLATPQEISAFVQQAQARDADYVVGLCSAESLDVFRETDSERAVGISVAYLVIQEFPDHESVEHWVEEIRARRDELHTLGELSVVSVSAI